MEENIVADVLHLKKQIDDDILPMDKLDEILLSRTFSTGKLLLGWNDRASGQKVVVRGDAFVKAILPFSSHFYDAEKAVFEYVSPHHVLAGAYYGVPKLSSDEGRSAADLLDSLSQTDHDETARYVKIGDFMLYVAIEGKNRVSLYRQLNREIGAKVFKSTYPPSDHLQLVKTQPFGTIALRYIGESQDIADSVQGWQSLSENLAAIPFEESVRLLEAYGVKWGSSQWAFSAPLTDRKIKLSICRRKYIR